MMSEDSREGYCKAKQERATITMEKFSSKLPSSSRQWPGFRNPRIVRVSQSFGGKDRHSKVSTIRGLRDRRIRLSVPTAVQLYDLQDRLGLSQPSKVIDWLLEATKYDIDKLPPLQMPHGFPQFHPQTLLPLHHHESTLSLHSSLEKGKWVKASEEENGAGISEVSFQKQFPSGVQYYNGMPYNYNPYHLEPASLSLSQFGSHGLVFPSQTEYANIPSSGGNGVQFSSCLSVVVPPPSGSQLLFYPSSAATPAFFAPHQIATSAEDSDPRGQFNNHVQSLSSSSSHVMPPHYPHISCLKALPAPFSSRLLDHSDRSQPHKESTR